MSESPGTEKGKAVSLGGSGEEEGNRSAGFGRRRCWEETSQWQKPSLGKSPKCGGSHLGFGTEKGWQPCHKLQQCSLY